MEKKITIAYAEDHDLMRTTISGLLNQMGFEVVITAKHGRELVDLLQQTQLPDICLLDVKMPILNGHDTAKEIKAKWPNQKIVALSMENLNIQIIQMFQSGAHAYIVKTGSADRIKHIIERVHYEGFYLDHETFSTLIQYISIPQRVNYQ